MEPSPPDSPDRPAAGPGPGPLVVVGIGADGVASLSAASVQLIEAAEVLIGGRRHLAAIGDGLAPEAVRAAWPSPLLPGLDRLLAEHRGRKIVVLASGDPLVSGIGTTLIDRLGAEAVTVHPAVSSVALARAAMGWSAEQSSVITLVGREEGRIRRLLADGRRIIALISGSEAIGRVADILCDGGFAASDVTVLSHLGEPDRQARHDSDAATLAGGEGTAENFPELSLLAIRCAGGPGEPLTPGLPDEAYDNDGQLTAAPIRALALAALAPRPGQLLWDIGAGAGSVGIEWARTDPGCRAVALERDPTRARRIATNALRRGVPDTVAAVIGKAPEALADLAARGTPDAVFVGGGGSRTGVLDSCWAALRPGGRMVVHAVTLETEAMLADFRRAHGGTLTRIAIDTAEPLGTMTGWRPRRPVVQWAATKPAEPSAAQKETP